MLNSIESGIIVPGLQEILKFAPRRREAQPSLLEVLKGEIRKGALRIGVFGSRKEGNYRDNSDLDIAVLNPKAGKTHLYAERYGDYMHCHNTGVTTIFCRWIDIQRFNPAEEAVDMENRIRAAVLTSTKWLWEKPIRSASDITLRDTFKLF